MSKNPISLIEAYDHILGGVMAISPDLYKTALEKIAEMTGRENNEQFQLEIAEIGRSMPCYLD